MADAFRGGAAFAASRTRGKQIEVQLPDIPLWVPAEANQVLGQLTRNTMDLSLQELAGWISQEAPVSEGHLAQSFTAQPATATGGIEITGAGADLVGRVFSSLPYAIVMNEGRRPGSPISREGIDAIGLWAQRKLGLSSDEASRAKWAIATAIIQRGIEGQHFVEAGADAAEPRILQLFAILSEQIAQQLTTGRKR